MDQLNSDFLAKLSLSITGEVKTDPTTRVLYSTDASIHKIEPLGAVFPSNEDELAAIVSLAGEYHVPLVPRGSGSSLAGQSIGNGLIVDCSRYLNKLLELDPAEKVAVVEPGLILDDLNRSAKKHGLQFGPDPASSERATIGGCIGNNASGAHSIRYGMTADHILSTEIVLANGEVTTFHPISLGEAQNIVDGKVDRPVPAIEADIYRAALKIRTEYREEIMNTWPITWRRTSGYNLNYLLPWSPTIPPQWDISQIPYPPVIADTLNLSPLVAGSEGTLAILCNATLRLVPYEAHTIVSVLSFPSIYDACNNVKEILHLSPSAIELIPQSLIRLARSVPAYASQLSFVQGDPAALLVVEFSGDDLDLLKGQVAGLNGLNTWFGSPIVAETPSQQKQVWAVRKMGLGILMSRIGDVKPATFIEDMSVPVERLGEFVVELERIFEHYGTTGDYYGHASAGCLHIRPLLNLKSVEGRKNLRLIAEAAVSLVLRLGGAVSAEHGDGIARGEWIERAYGPRIMEAFKMLKHAADPHRILNPGKIVNSPSMDTALRYDDEYQPAGWAPVMRFSSQQPDPGRLVEAIEQCNGAGVCRKSDGVMCPSFQATQDEMYSTRGRANLLRAMVSNGFASQGVASEAVKATLEICLACKGCKAECPSAVDMAKLKYEFYQFYYKQRGHHRPIRDYLFGYISQVAKIGTPFAPLVNHLLFNKKLASLQEKLLGISRNRALPRLSGKTFHALVNPNIGRVDDPDCLFLSDAFNEYFYPHIGLDAMKVLVNAGCKVRVLSTIGSGRTLISKGFLDQVKHHAHKLVEEINQIDPVGKLPVVGLEPSEVYTLKDEYLDLVQDQQKTAGLASRSYMMDEFLLRPGADGLTRISRLRKSFPEVLDRTNVLLHGHCYQKAQPPASDGLPMGVAASVAVLEEVGYRVKSIDDGCCGMAGAFGYEAEHYALSMSVGELFLFPSLREDETATIAASGVSCKAQIEDATGRQVFHPISLVARRCGGNEL